MHIICLELLSATLAVQTFAKKLDSLLIHLKMDDTSVLTYINKMGGTVTPELDRLTKGLWSWCLARNITIYASQLPGSLDEKAGEESRIMNDQSDRRLCPGSFKKVQAQFSPIHVETDKSAFGICELAARSRGGGDRCILSELETKGICQPAMELDRPNPGPSSTTESNHCTGSCGRRLKRACPPARVADRGAIVSPLDSRSDLANTPGQPPEPKAPPSHMAYLKILCRGNFTPGIIPLACVAESLGRPLNGILIPFQMLQAW